MYGLFFSCCLSARLTAFGHLTTCLATSIHPAETDPIAEIRLPAPTSGPLAIPAIYSVNMFGTDNTRTFKRVAHSARNFQLKILRQTRPSLAAKFQRGPNHSIAGIASIASFSSGKNSTTAADLKRHTARSQHSPTKGYDATTTAASASASNPSTASSNSPSLDALMANLRPHARYKARSYNTSKNSHIPLLQAHLAVHPSDGPKLVLLGDSMFERMITTGRTPNFPSPWPSETMHPDTDELLAVFPHLEDRRLCGIFNAGVGGDKVQNVIYRLVGDEERGLPALLPILAPSVKVWVVHAGGNNLTPAAGWSEQDEAMVRELARALLAVSPGSRVALTQMFYRKDVPLEIVNDTNARIRRIAKQLREAGFGDTVDCWRPPRLFRVRKHLQDQAHLNLEGYRVWTEQLLVRFRSFLRPPGARGD